MATLTLKVHSFMSEWEEPSSSSLSTGLPQMRCIRRLLSFGRFSVIAMEMSLGKRSPRTKAWTTVETRRADTVNVDMAERATDSTWVNGVFTSAEYLMAAMAAPVIGKV